jgi:Ca-activated chloride channel family protein
LKKLLFHFAFIFIGIFYIQPSYSQTPKDNTKPVPPTTRILFIFDCSQSMAGKWESDKKINIARKFLIHTIDSLEKTEYTQMALRVYGHQSPVPPQDCGDTRLEVPFAKGNAPKIRQKLRYLVPRGTTPIANSLAQSANDFPKCDNCRNIVILITDGIEKCDGDPCAVSTELQKEGIFLEPFIIGIGLDPDFRETFECVGKLYNADDESRFQQVLDVVINEALNSTTAQVNLLDEDGYPSETNVAMSFYDSNSGRLKYNYIHTINNRGKPDTIILDPLIEYRLVVHTLPPVIVDNIKVFKGKHNIIAADTPQGTLNIKTKGTRYKSLKVLIRKAGDIQTVNMQTVDTPEKYLIGKYDLEIPVLPRINVKDITIKQSVTTTVSIPVPGLITLLMTNPGYCSIYVEKGLELEWVYNVSSDVKHETIVLQPGTYRIIYRPKFAKSIYYTSEKRIVVRSGSSQSVKLH